MHALSILSQIFKKSRVIKHEKRINGILHTVSSLLNGGKLSIASLGRHLPGTAKVKNKIKGVDALLSNGALYHEKKDIYKMLAEKAIGNQKFIIVLVDWSPVPHSKNHIIKASLSLRKRSITLYEEVHPEKNLENAKVHKNFLSRLKKIIPFFCDVLVVTDAGFRTDFFLMVLENEWDFLGRVRSNMLYTSDLGKQWKTCFSLYEKAKIRTKYIGTVLLSKTNKLKCQMYLHKEHKVNINQYKRKIKSGRMEKEYIKSYQDPWILVTSVQHKEKTKRLVVNAYKRRMQIEHEFRNIKNDKWGLGLRYSRTRSPLRLEILLLIGALAIFLLWLIGLAAEKLKIHYDFQANTIRDRRVLSLVFLGEQIIYHDYLSRIKLKNIEDSLEEIRSQNIEN